MAQKQPFSLPRPERRQRFSLLPLADCMLQLLIFFMLASGMSMYSLLPLRQGEALGQGGAPSGAGEEPAASATGRVIWTVDAGAVLANGQRLGLAALPDLARVVGADPEAEVLLLTTEGATVQDLVLVLEALQAAGISQVAIVAREA